MSVDASLCSLAPGEDLFCDFDWEGVEPDVRRQVVDLAQFLVAGFVARLGNWIHGDGQGKPQGVMIRAHIAFWDCLPYLRRLRQTELAELMGLAHKQSVGREVSDFRDRFGWRNGHMQSERAREVCREREAKKGKVSQEAAGGAESKV